MSRRPAYQGFTKDRPLTLGRANGDEPRFAVATGLVMGIRINEERWVTGEAVEHALLEGLLVEIQTEQRPTGINLATQLCDRCGEPVNKHGVYHDEPTAEQLAGQQASFGGVEFPGFYCPVEPTEASSATQAPADEATADAAAPDDAGQPDSPQGDTAPKARARAAKPT